MAFATDLPLPQQLHENLRFVRGLIANPRNVASVFPSSRSLARKIAEQVDPSGGDLVLELGPGTGAITAALLERGVRPEQLLLIERDPDFVESLHGRFPTVSVREGDALDIDAALGAMQRTVAAVVSGLPLLNFPDEVRRKLVDRALDRVVPGGPFVQLTFGLKPPVGESVRWDIHRVGRVYSNIPPATVWTYTRPRLY
ncbi:MAG: methyltransferase domain-containing protein [Alphaproteobacteria bacterium]|nr:methyltransferase domain-containing protein [Alphaproteobacteria bacterium]